MDEQEMVAKLMNAYLDYIAREGKGINVGLVLAELVDTVNTTARRCAGRQDSYNTLRNALYRLDFDPDELMAAYGSTQYTVNDERQIVANV